MGQVAAAWVTAADVNAVPPVCTGAYAGVAFASPFDVVPVNVPIAVSTPFCTAKRWIVNVPAAVASLMRTLALPRLGAAALAFGAANAARAEMANASATATPLNLSFINPPYWFCRRSERRLGHPKL